MVLLTRPAQKITIVLKHGTGAAKPVSITLGKAPDNRAEGFIGLRGVDHADVKFRTTINLEKVGGPRPG